MRYIDQKDLVDGESYICQTYDGYLVCCDYVEDFEDKPFELLHDSDISFSWDQIRFVLETTNQFIEKFK